MSCQCRSRLVLLRNKQIATHLLFPGFRRCRPTCRSFGALKVLALFQLIFQGRLVTFQPLPCSLERLISLINSSRLSLPTSSWVAAFYFVRVTGPFAGLSTLPDGLEKNHLESQNLGPPFRFDTLLIRPHGARSTRQQPLLYRLTNQFDTLFVRPHGARLAQQQTFHTRISEMLVVSLLAMSQTLRSHSNVWLRPSSRGRVVAEPMLSRGKAGGAHVPAAQLAGFYNNAHCELLPLQHTLAVAREELHLFWARTRGAANSPVSDRRHDDSVRTPCPTWNHGGRHTTFQRPHCRVLYFDHAHQGCPPLVTGYPTHVKENGTCDGVPRYKNLTCHVSAGSRLVLLRTKQIATQSFIPEFSIFSVLSDSFFIAYWEL
ncbi:hypothetical protein PAPYR_11193 [Paratrimastix pyriformis]|uniref:Uncharacterized protein n=1 Tax=Paratrimastix pyriformis TaxID=342808 RepID=A0ABQ8U4B1_9EUKA|nr:hypothetical protein PAPYR_11193 [Paratrimastix pyriformis]